MPRGGKREKAGRKTTWHSGVKFEDTSILRIPTYIKDKVLELAHRLDAGEIFDLETNSKQREECLKELELQNKNLTAQLRKLTLESESDSRDFENKIDSLQQEKKLLLQRLDPQNLHCDLVTKSKNDDSKLVTNSEIVEQMELPGLRIDSEVDILEPLTAADLSRRFGKESDFVKHKKRYYKNRMEEFYLLLKDNDPQKVGWIYSDEDKKYHPTY